MKPELVMVGPMYPATQEKLEELFVIHRLWEASDRDRFLEPLRERVRGIVLYAPHGCPGWLIEGLPKTEIIANFGVGYDAVDIPTARAKGIRVVNTPDVLTEDVADLALALLLALERRIAEGDRFVRRGDWLKGELAFGRRLGGRKLGIIGFGRIGQAIAHRAAAFGMQVAYHGPRPKADISYPYFDSAAALAGWSEILMLACPGGPATLHLVDAAVLAALGSEGTIVNIARGSVIDEPALVKALQAGTIAGAALDVFEDEPRVPAELMQMENVVLVPHTGSATHGTRAAMGQLVIDNLVAHFAGQPLLTPVT